MKKRQAFNFFFGPACFVGSGVRSLKILDDRRTMKNCMQDVALLANLSHRVLMVSEKIKLHSHILLFLAWF